MEAPLRTTADGLESQVATNYVGPFALSTLLLPHITDRVVSVSSQLHRRGTVHLDDIAGTARSYKANDAYSDSKLALNLFSAELQRRLSAAGSPVTSVLAHPGIATTSLVTHASSGKVVNALGRLFNDAETGALSILFAATEDVPGNAYVGPRGLFSMKGHPTVRTQSAASLDAETARRLWQLTAELTGTDSNLPSAA